MFKHSRPLALLGLVLALMFVAGALAGCGNPTTSPPPSETPAPTGQINPDVTWPNVDFNAMKGEHITVPGAANGSPPYAYWRLGDGQEGRPNYRVDKFRIHQDFLEEYGLIIDWDTAGFGYEKLKLRVSTGNGPTVFNGEMDNFPQYPMQNLIQPIDQWISPNDNALSPVMLDITYNGKKYCMFPQEELSFRAVMYNMDWYTERGIDTPMERYEKNGEYTWDELFEDSFQMCEIDPATGQNSKFGLQMYYTDMAAAYALNDAEVFTVKEDNGVYTYALNIDDDKVMNIFNMLIDGMKAGKIVYGFGSWDELKRGNHNMLMQIWDRSRQLQMEGVDADTPSVRLQSVPIPIGPDAEMQKGGNFCNNTWFAMVGSQSPNPSFGVGWYWWLCRPDLEPNYRPNDTPVLKGDDYINSLPENLQYQPKFLEEAQMNGHWINPAAPEGIPGLWTLFESLYNRTLRQNRNESFFTVLAELRPQMENAIEKINKGRPPGGVVEPPRDPILPGVITFDDPSMFRLPAADPLPNDNIGWKVEIVDDGIEGKSYYFHVDHIGPNSQWAFALFDIIPSSAIKFTGLKYYKVTFDYKFLENEAFEAGDLWMSQEGFRIGFFVQEEDATEPEFCGGSFTGTIVVEGMDGVDRITHQNQAMENDVFLRFTIAVEGMPVDGTVPLDLLIDNIKIIEVEPPADAIGAPGAGQ